MGMVVEPCNPASSKKAEAAKSFLKWATSKEYVELVGKSEGWVAVPPGTRQIPTYANEEYKKAAPFADTVLKAIESADPTKPTKDPVPYTGIQFVAIPEFQAIGTLVGQAISSAVARVNRASMQHSTARSVRSSRS